MAFVHSLKTKLPKINRALSAPAAVYGGIQLLRAGSKDVDRNERLLAAIRQIIPEKYESFLPLDTELVTRILGSAEILSALLLAFDKGKLTRNLLFYVTTAARIAGAKAK